MTQALETVIYKGPRALACTPDITAFIQEEIQRRIKYGFSILLPAVDKIRLFREWLKFSRIMSMPQAHRRPRLILNISAQLDSDMLNINKTTDREAAPELLQFSKSSPRILQAVWEVDPV